MRTHPPRPWFSLAGVVAVVATSFRLVCGREIDGCSAFVAWDMLITRAACPGFAIFDYCRKWVAHRQYQAGFPADVEPDV